MPAFSPIDSCGADHKHGIDPDTAPGEDPDGLRDRRPCRQNVVDENHARRPAGSRTRCRDDPARQVLDARPRRKTDRILNSPSKFQHGHHRNRFGRQRRRRREHRPGHRISPTRPRCPRPGRRRHQGQCGEFRRVDLAEFPKPPHGTGQCVPERPREVPASALLCGDHRAAARTRVPPQRPGRNPRIEPGREPHRVGRQLRPAPVTPVGACHPTAAALTGQDQVDERAHAPQCAPALRQSARQHGRGLDPGQSWHLTPVPVARGVVVVELEHPARVADEHRRRGGVDGVDR